MKIFPAIDLRGGNAVRLFQGDYDRETVYSDSPVDVARTFKEAGASCLHLVDLDGAKDGRLVNFDTIKDIVSKVEMFVQVGGGIRDEERIRQYLDLGVGRVILGTIAQKDLEFLKEMVERYGSSIAVGVDAKDGKVAINGWKEVTEQDSFSFCEDLAAMGVKTVIYTDIGKDGGMGGTNMQAYEKLRQIPGLDIVASGGITFEWEIEKLADMVSGAIVGKALYTGGLDLKRCIEIGEKK
ncbi:MAG: 1-(5-phosphoribosyl)-5-[(5-phosphoribosylamino)methylideneamino]imidazole-4-carboxamide isomerase [Anaerovoracaceae bacterium]